MATFAYIRYSTDKQSNSLECQWDQAQKRAEFLGLTIDVAHRFIDKAQSGSIRFRLRPAAKALMDALQPGDTLIVTALDRLGRNLRDLLHVIDELVEKQVNIHIINFAGMSLDMKSAVGRLLVQLLGAVAEFERNLLRERMKAAIETRKAANLRISKWKPPGKEPSPQRTPRGETIYVYSKTEWDLMAEVYLRHEKLGETFYSIGLDFERRGLRTNNNGPWVYFRPRRRTGANVRPMQKRYEIYKNWIEANEGREPECAKDLVFIDIPGPVKPTDVPAITRSEATERQLLPSPLGS